MRRYFVPLLFAAVACHTDSVVAPPQPPASGFADAKNMSVGEVRVLTPSQLPNGIELSASAVTSDYLLVVANTSPALDVPANYVVRGNELTSEPARQNILAPSNLVAVTDGRTVDAQAAVDAHVGNWVRSHLKPSMAGTSGARAAVLTVQERAALGLSAVVLNVGDQVTIKVPQEDSTNLCKNFITTTGTVQKVSNKAILITDNQQPTTTFTPTDFADIANEFDTIVYPTDVSYFGTPTDYDNNGGRIIMYFTPEVNKLTPPNNPSFVGGFFFGGDLFKVADCAQSNYGEIFYLLAPDPNGVINNNIRTTARVRQGTRGTIAHEFQHMINAGVRITNNSPAFESVWLDEGLAHTAEDAVGRVVKGFGDFTTLTDPLLYPPGTTQGSTAANDYNAYFGQNLTRLKYWLASPDTSSPLSKHADKDLSSRGAIWALLRWTGDQYSGGNFRAYTKKLVAGPDTGVKNLTTVTGQPLDTLISGWMVANYSDHTGIPGLPSKYNYVGYNIRETVSGAANLSVDQYPLAVTTLLAGSSVSTKALPGSGTYYRVTVPAGGGRTILVQDPGGTNASFPGAHYYVLRID